MAEKEDRKSSEEKITKNVRSTVNTLCKRCKGAQKIFRSSSLTEPNALLTHVDICDDITGKKKSNTKKQEKIKEIEIILSALRNTQGGILLVHLSGLADEDRFLGTFDEFIEDSLKKLICDGKPFTDTYTRSWFHKLEGAENFKDFLVITVAKTTGVATVDFNTRIGSDLQIEKPSSFNIFELLKKRSKAVKPVLKGIAEIPFESRSIQLKTCDPQLDKKAPPNLLRDAEVLARYIWAKLRFREYLSSISKIATGGSYYVGITEKNCQYSLQTSETRSEYSSRVPETCGFTLQGDRSLVKKSLESIIREEVVLIEDEDTINCHPSVPDLIEVEFYDIKDNKVVLEIAIGHVNGILFYNKLGPEAYEMTESGSPRRMSLVDWLRKMNQHTKQSM
ncbi:uncharacterized protein [Haliotis cracherodii]